MRLLAFALVISMAHGLPEDDLELGCGYESCPKGIPGRSEGATELYILVIPIGVTLAGVRSRLPDRDQKLIVGKLFG